MTYYKIRHKITGLFSKGGDDKWNKSGKTWATLGHLRLHITCLLNDAYANPDFGKWEVIEYEVTEKGRKSIHEMVSPDKLLDLLKRK